MALMFTEEPMESRLQTLAQRQPTPVTKTAMARAILLHALELCETTDDPLAWLEALRMQPNGKQTTTTRRKGAATPAA